MRETTGRGKYERTDAVRAKQSASMRETHLRRRLALAATPAETSAAEEALRAAIKNRA